MEYTDISISTYLEVQKAILNKELNDNERMILICRSLFNTEIEQLPIQEAVELMDKATELLSSNFKSSESPIISKINVNGIKCTVTDMDSMTFSQYIDFQNFSKDANEHLIDLLAVAIVPKGAKYNDNSYDLNELKENLAKLPITVALSIVRFFQVRSLDSLMRSLIYSTETRDLKLKDKLKVKWNLLKTLVAMELMKFHLAH